MGNLFSSSPSKPLPPPPPPVDNSAEVQAAKQKERRRLAAAGSEGTKRSGLLNTDARPVNVPQLLGESGGMKA